MKHRWILSTTLALATTVGGAGCSQHSSAPRYDDGYYRALANERSRTAIVQFGVDTKQLTEADFGPGVLDKGVVVIGVALLSWFDDQKTLHNLAAGSSVTLQDEAERAAHVFQMTAMAQSNEDRKRKTPPISVDEAARVVVLQALVDGNWITRADAGAAVDDDSGQVVPGAATDAWFTAHADQPLVQGAGVTVRAEVARFDAVFGRPPVG